MTDIPKRYDPAAVEQKWYRYWEKYNLFRTDPNSGKKPFCILMPPPNVTGELHMGHALQDSLQDMLVRLKRMQGYESLWQPGKDHAGIATQNVVEKSLAKQGISRQSLGREKFIDKVWEWKERYGDRIFEQKKLLGDSADWSRERFTLDEGSSRTVTEVFVRLYNKRLIYRGDYIVNWCPRCHTAISDEEVDHEEHSDHLWYFRYPIAPPPGSPHGNREGLSEKFSPPVPGGELKGGQFVTVATTRPETMLGDTAVAVNPDDERFRHLWDARVILPLVGREIPVIRDDFVDPSFGTGQVKVTPAHDPNDFAMGQRHRLASVVVMNEDGTMNDNAPVEFRGLDRFKARAAVVEAMRGLGLLEKIEDYTTSIGHCQRCHTVIEPYLSTQWFVKMKPLAEPAIQAVREGRIKFHPPRWEKVYYSWMENIRDWCISRQLWWGHRIPVWYCACGEVIVAEFEPEACPKCKSYQLKQDEDVLDTWFSSWLWPFSTLGWPENTGELKFWYPTDVLVSGYDIIFFWIARMIMAGIEFAGDIPFRDVYITGMIKDELGRWMSKSLGNGIDPAEMVEKYGSDAVRFTLITLATEGQDIKLAPARFEGGRNFANKLWNSYRFLVKHANELDLTKWLAQTHSLDLNCDENTRATDRILLNGFRHTIEEVLKNLTNYRFSDIAMLIYGFIWNQYCSWELEELKPSLTRKDDVARIRLWLATTIFRDAMRLLHPLMPFITEEIWQGLSFVSSEIENQRSIMHKKYPKPDDYPIFDDNSFTSVVIGREMVDVTRVLKSAHNLPSGLTPIVSGSFDPNIENVFRAQYGEEYTTLSGINDYRVDPNFNAPAISGSTSSGITINFPMTKEELDEKKQIERRRLDKEIARMEAIIKSAEAKLSNPKFALNAPDEVIYHERRKLDECRMQLAAVERNRRALE